MTRSVLHLHPNPNVQNTCEFPAYRGIKGGGDGSIFPQSPASWHTPSSSTASPKWSLNHRVPSSEKPTPSGTTGLGTLQPLVAFRFPCEYSTDDNPLSACYFD